MDRRKDSEILLRTRISYTIIALYSIFKFCLINAIFDCFWKIRQQKWMKDEKIRD